MPIVLMRRTRRLMQMQKIVARKPLKQILYKLQSVGGCLGSLAMDHKPLRNATRLQIQALLSHLKTVTSAHTLTQHDLLAWSRFPRTTD